MHGHHDAIRSVLADNDIADRLNTVKIRLRFAMSAKKELSPNLQDRIVVSGFSHQDSRA